MIVIRWNREIRTKAELSPHIAPSRNRRPRVPVSRHCGVIQYKLPLDARDGPHPHRLSMGLDKQPGRWFRGSVEIAPPTRNASAVRDVRTIVRDVLNDAMSTHRLDALIGPTAIPARLISEEHVIVPPGWRALASMSGWPDVSVPAGFTKESKVPVGLSFLGPALSDVRLLGLAHAFERATQARRVPITTPPLPGERFEY